ncbi:MAG: nucleoside recognition protein [Rhodothermia bacterium]|nr:nucleoside recognition protein [Rhodothermia bacterium]
MLNYIWGGLVIFSLIFAIISDVRDLSRDTYRNGDPLPVHLLFPDGYAESQRRTDVEVHVNASVYKEFYGTEETPADTYAGVLVQTADGRELRFAKDVVLPEPLATVRSTSSGSDNELRAEVTAFTPTPADTAVAIQASIQLPRVRFVKMAAIAQAALDFAETAVTIAIGLIGALALWLGLLRIAEKSGMLYSLVRMTQPILRKLFPEIPEGHPAMGMIALNLTANMLGLGNAATPLGLKAMEELQTLNQTEDTATNSMVMLLALNTASVQVVPPVLLVAIMGLQINQLFFSILIVTLISAVVAVIVTKLIGKLNAYQKTDPALIGTADAGESTETSD